MRIHADSDQQPCWPAHILGSTTLASRARPDRLKKKIYIAQVGELACQGDPLADLPGSNNSGSGTHHHHFFPLPESDPLEVASISRVSSAGGHSPSPSGQGCGSAFISSGSGSSILGWIPVRIQGFNDQKLKKITAEKFLTIFFGSETAIYLSIDPIESGSNPDPDPQPCQQVVSCCSWWTAGAVGDAAWPL